MRSWLVLFAILLGTVTCRAYSGAQSTGGAQLHWTDSAVSIARDPGAPSLTLAGDAVDAALAAACAAWSVPEARVQLSQSGKPVANTIRFVAAGWPYDANMLAYTVLDAHPLSGVITSATIQLNEQHHRFVAGHDDAEAYDLQAVLTHELGHVLGLAHSTDAHATMFASTAPKDETQRVPDADDRAGIAAVYDTVATPVSTPSAETPADAMPAVPATGCSFGGSAARTPGAAGLALALVLLLLAARRVTAWRSRCPCRSTGRWSA